MVGLGLLIPVLPMIPIQAGIQPISAGIQSSRGRGRIIGNAGLNRENAGAGTGCGLASGIA